MVDVPLDMYMITVTAVDNTGKKAIYSGEFSAISKDGQGPRIDGLKMYDNKKPVSHPFAVDPNIVGSHIWLIKAYNVDKTYPAFYAEYSLDIKANRDLCFVITPK